MADPEKAAADDIVDEAQHAARGTRSAARWIASALGAIPSLAVLGALVRAPGDAGFDPALLAVGIALAAAGAFIGILAFARVLTPVELEDKHLTRFRMERIPGNRWPKFNVLSESMSRWRETWGTESLDAATEAQRAEGAKASAVAADRAATALEAQAKAAPRDKQLQKRAQNARALSERRQAEAIEAAALAAAAAAGEEQAKEQFLAREAIRAHIYRLKAADEVRKRFSGATLWAAVATALVAAGVFFLAVSPVPKTDGEMPRLVALRLTDAGKAALACNGNDLHAIKIGGEDAQPLLITLPTAGCPARLVEFATAEPGACGTISEEEPINE